MFMSLSSDIKEYALSIGFHRVGFTTLDKFPIYEEELARRRKTYEWRLEKTPTFFDRTDFSKRVPGAKSIIVVIFDFLNQAVPPEMEHKVGRYYLLWGPPRPVHRDRLNLIMEFLQRRGIHAALENRLPVRQAAARAGISTFGKNTFAISEGIGSFVSINTIVADVELEYDRPTIEVDCPEKCTLCLDACPTGALYEPLRMDPVQCIAYNSYATPGSPMGSRVQIIPKDIRSFMGTWIYGCDACQQVCPKNRAKLKSTFPPDAYLESVSGDYALEKLLVMSEEHLGRVVPLLRYINDKQYYRRNAAVALGNSGDEASVRPLTDAMQDPSDIVRMHAAWALGRIGDARARAALETSIRSDPSHDVRLEIRMALER